METNGSDRYERPLAPLILKAPRLCQNTVTNNAPQVKRQLNYFKETIINQKNPATKHSRCRALLSLGLHGLHQFL